MIDAQPCLDGKRFLEGLQASFDTGDFAAVERHVAHCPKCAAALQELERGLHGMVNVLRPAAPSETEHGDATSRFATTPFHDTYSFRGPQATFSEGVEATELSTVEQFQVVRLLGRGGMGAVYEAIDTQLGRRVALKLPRHLREDDPEFADRFLREARSAAALRHPNICSLYQVGEVAGRPFLAMDLIDGVTLRVWAAEPRTWRDVVPIVAKLARAVEYAHSKGLVHRDLKPDNVMIDAQTGEPILMDFGMAKEMGENIQRLTMTGQIMGTPAYMAPEQVLGRSDEIGPTTDVYALGVILFELLCNQRPFSGAPQQLFHKILNEEPPALRRFESSAPRDLEVICQRCLEKAPDKRLPSAGDLSRELERVLRGEPIRSRPIGPLARTWRWCRRNPLVAILSLSVVIALATGAVAASLFALAAKRNADDATQALHDMREEKDRADRNANEVERRRREAEDLRNEALRIQRQIEYARRSNYAFHLAQVPLVLEKDPPRARELLLDPLKCPEELRDFVWKFLYHAAQKPFNPDRPLADHVLATDHKGIYRLNFSPDSKRLASAGGDGVVHLWNVDPPQLQRSLAGHATKVYAVEFSRDGRVLATGSLDGTVGIWDAGTGARLATLLPSGESEEPALSDASADATSSELFGITLSEVKGVLRLAVGLGLGVRSLAFSPDAKRMVIGRRNGTVELWGLAPYRRIASRRIWNPDSQFMYISEVAFAPDGQSVVSASKDGYVRLWSADEEMAELHMFTRHHGDDPLPIGVWSVAFSSDGDLLASGDSHGTVYLWNPQTGETRAELKWGLPQFVKDLAFSPDGSVLATVGMFGTDFHNTNPGIVQLWDAKMGQLRATLYGHPTPVESVAFSPNGEWLATGDIHEIRLWRAPLPSDTSL